MSVTFTDIGNFVTESCCNCHVVFAMPQALHTQRRTDGGLFYCPNGHSQHYTETKVMQLEAEVQRQKFAKERAQTREAEEIQCRRRAEHRIRALRGCVTRFKNARDKKR